MSSLKDSKDILGSLGEGEPSGIVTSKEERSILQTSAEVSASKTRIMLPDKMHIFGSLYKYSFPWPII